MLSGRRWRLAPCPPAAGLGGNGTLVASLALLGPGGVGAWPQVATASVQAGPGERPPAAHLPTRLLCLPHSSPLPPAVPLPACASHSFTPAGAAGHLGAGLGGCGAKGKLCRGTPSCPEPPEAPGDSLYAEASVLLGAQGFSQGPGTQQTTVLLPHGRPRATAPAAGGENTPATGSQGPAPAQTQGARGPRPALCCHTERLRQGAKRPSCHPGKGSRFLPQGSAPAPPSWPLPRVPPRNSWLAARLPQAGSWVSSSLRPRSTR